MSNSAIQRHVLYRQLCRFVRAQDGATAIEYAMIASMLSMAIVGSAFLLGGGVQDMWTMVKTEVVAALEH